MSSINDVQIVTPRTKWELLPNFIKIDNLCVTYTQN